MTSEQQEDRALTRRECDRCPIHTEVDGLQKWVSKIDNRMWAVLVLALGNLVATLVK